MINLANAVYKSDLSLVIARVNFEPESSSSHESSSSQVRVNIKFLFFSSYIVICMFLNLFIYLFFCIVICILFLNQPSIDCPCQSSRPQYACAVFSSSCKQIQAIARFEYSFDLFMFTCIRLKSDHISSIHQGTKAPRATSLLLPCKVEPIAFAAKSSQRTFGVC